MKKDSRSKLHTVVICLLKRDYGERPNPSVITYVNNNLGKMSTSTPSTGTTGIRIQIENVIMLLKILDV